MRLVFAACLALTIVLPLTSSARVNPLRVLTGQAFPQLTVVFAYNTADPTTSTQAANLATALGLVASNGLCQDGANNETCASATGATDCGDPCCMNEPICTKALYLQLGPLVPGSNDATARIGDGRAYFETWVPAFQPDPASACRKRAVLLISDGTGLGAGAVAAAQNLYNLYPGNPIRTFVAALPATTAPNRSLLDDVADAGNDGNPANDDATATWAVDVPTLAAAIRSKIDNQLLDAVQGDYPGSPSTATSLSTSSKSVGLVPSFEYPGWRGHVRAIDYSTTCAMGCTAPATCHIPSGFCQLWDARGSLDTIIAAHTRQLYTAYPGVNCGGRPICKLATWSGGNWNVALADVKSVWSMAGALPSNAEIIATVRWLMDKSLGPIINSVPASVGTPPRYALAGAGADHGDYVIAQSNRERMIYVASNDGILHALRERNGDELFGYIPADAWPQIYRLYQNGGQPADPRRHIWILANSPRVEDNRSNGGGGTWRTDLFLPAGPGGANFSVIDITDPGQCDEIVNCATFTPTSPPFRIVTHSIDLNNAYKYVGEAWSLASYFWRDNDYELAADMGSGYRTIARMNSDPGEKENEYFTYWEKTWTWSNDPNEKYDIAPVGGCGSLTFMMPPVCPVLPLAPSPPGNPAHNYAALGDVAGVINPDNRQVVASYQSTLNGTVLRFDRGKAGSRSTIITAAEAGPTQPFHFGPAALFRSRSGVTAVTLAAVSGSALEEHSYMWSGGFESTIFLRREDGGAVDGGLDNLTKKISTICTPSANYTVPAGSCPFGAPSSQAKPVADPILLGDLDLTDGFVELFALYQEPPATACGTPTSWLVHMRSDGSAAANMETVQYAGTQMTGMTIIGDSTKRDILFTSVGKGGNQAGATKRTATPVGGTSGIYGLPTIEYWREVQ